MCIFIIENCWQLKPIFLQVILYIVKVCCVGFQIKNSRVNHDWTKLLYNSVVVDLLKPSVDASERCKLWGLLKLISSGSTDCSGSCPLLWLAWQLCSWKQHWLWMAVPALRPSPNPPSSYSWPHCVRTAVHGLPLVRAGTALWLWYVGRSSWGPLWLQTPGSGQVGSVVGAVDSAALQHVGQGMSRTPCAGTWEGPAQVFGREVRNEKAARSSGTGDTLGRRQVKRLSGCTPCGRPAAAPSGEPPLRFSCLGASRLCFEKVTSDSQLISVGKMFWPRLLCPWLLSRLTVSCLVCFSLSASFLLDSSVVLTLALVQASHSVYSLDWWLYTPQFSLASSF